MNGRPPADSRFSPATAGEGGFQLYCNSIRLNVSGVCPPQGQCRVSDNIDEVTYGWHS